MIVDGAHFIGRQTTQRRACDVRDHRWGGLDAEGSSVDNDHH